QNIKQNIETLQKKATDLEHQYTTKQATLKDIESEIKALGTKMERLIKQLTHGIEAMESEMEDLKSDYIEYLNERAVLQNEKQSIKRQLDDLKKERIMNYTSNNSY